MIHYTANNQVMDEGEMVLMDAGCELQWVQRSEACRLFVWLTRNLFGLEVATHQTSPEPGPYQASSRTLKGTCTPPS